MQKLTEAEKVLLDNLKILTEAHRLSPNFYNISAMNTILRELSVAYVRRLTKDEPA